MQYIIIFIHRKFLKKFFSKNMCQFISNINKSLTLSNYLCVPP